MKTCTITCLMLFVLMILSMTRADFMGPKKVDWYECSLFTNTPSNLEELRKMGLYQKDQLNEKDIEHIIKMMKKTNGKRTKTTTTRFQDWRGKANFAPESISFEEVIDIVATEQTKEIQENIGEYATFDERLYATNVLRESLETVSIKAQCGLVEMPLDHTNATDRHRVRVFMKAYPPTGKALNETTKTMYVLQGGPGGSSDSLEPYMYYLRKYLPDYTIVYLEHRGVGRSHRLGCVAAQAETQNSPGGVSITEDEMVHCAKDLAREYPTHYALYSTTQAAYDLLTLINDIQAPVNGSTTIVYGISYGTFWGGRFLQLPDATQNVDKVIFDGIVSQKGSVQYPNDRTELNQWDSRMNQVGLYLLDVFDKIYKEDFSEKVADAHIKVNGEFYKYDNGRQFIADVFEQVYNKQSCTYRSANGTETYNIEQIVPKDDLKALMGGWLINVELRELIPALLFRLLRCDEFLDIPTLLHLSQVLTKIQQERLKMPYPARSSEMLYRNIAFSEIWSTTPVTYEQLRKEFDEAYIATGTFNMANSYKNFKHYDDSHLLHTYENIEKPILLINGDLDPQTPFEYTAAQYNNTKVTCPNIQMVKIPYAPHFTVMRSKWNAVPGRPTHCGMDLVIQFVLNDQEILDLNCTHHVIPPSFMNPTQAETFFGVKDAFNGRYEPESEPLQVSLMLFIAVIAVVVVISVIIICFLIYCVISQWDKNKHYRRMQDA